MSFDYKKLNGKIISEYGTQYNFAIAMGLSDRSMSLKLNGKSPWRDTEIYQAADLLDIDGEELEEYFFTPKVHA